MKPSASLRIAIFAVLATVLVWPVLAQAAHMNEFRDAQVLALYEHAAVDTVKRYGEWPLWNPYYCGGLDGLGTPQSRFASPTFLLSLIFGVERAEPILVFLLAFLGMEGTYRWVRLRASEWPSMLVAPVFALSGYFAVSYFRGWTSFFGFELVPWILLGVTLATHGKIRGIWVAALGFAFLIGFGGTYAAPLVTVAMLLEGLRALWERPRRERRRALAMLVSCALFMIAFSAFRLWPLAETLSAAPRIMAGTPGHFPKAIFGALVDAITLKDGDTTFAGSFYVGIAFLSVVALGVSDRKGAKGIAIAVVFVWFAGGYARRPGLFPMLRELPVFAALRYPERFLWLAILFACEPAARALETVPRMGEGKGWRYGSLALMGGALLWTIVGEVRGFETVASARDLGGYAQVAEQPFRQARGNRWLAVHEEANNLGSLSCWETYPVPQSPLLRADLPAEEYPVDPRTARVKRLSWSPNRIVLDVNMLEAGTIRINQNWHRGWRASIGNVVSNEGLLAIELPSGKHTLTVRFRPWSALAGGAVSGLAVLVLLVMSVRRRRGWVPFTRASWKLSALAVMLPLLVGGAAFAFSPEPRPARPIPKGPDESPVLVDSAPTESTPLHAEYTGGIRLEAVGITGPDRLGNVGVDLWLAREAPISRDITMFVRFQRREGEPAPDNEHDTFYNRDHQVLAGSFYLADAPKEQLVHDVIGVNMGKAAKGTWDVWVAFGHFSGKGGRWPVSTTATVDADRVRVGTFTIH